ncbi:unnamed protein product [Angiostrongylus costaricensis]|uniref:Uncharacterized protein n=1 Tax=Angiostrongylus costaricensis TaxID=334426 RepID=A0A0R3Q1F0_ANGCS|nr:unnamed protein product [Angiostrongylus costaricensis]
MHEYVLVNTDGMCQISAAETVSPSSGFTLVSEKHNFAIGRRITPDPPPGEVPRRLATNQKDSSVREIRGI